MTEIVGRDSWLVDKDGWCIAATRGARRVRFVINGQDDGPEFESALPDAHTQVHRRRLFLKAGDEVRTSTGQPLTLAPEV